MATIIAGTQGVAAGLHRHGQGILVPIGHGPLALALTGQIGRDPGIRSRDRLAAKAQARRIGTPGRNPDHFNPHLGLLFCKP